MKTKSAFRFALVFAALAFAFLLAFPALVHAQDTATATPVLSADTQNFVLNFISGLAVKYPVIATIIGILGTMRLWAKPAFSAIHSVIELTPTSADDGMWAKCYDWLTGTPTGKTVAWLLDYVTSIKLVPPAKPAVTPAPPVV